MLLHKHLTYGSENSINTLKRSSIRVEYFSSSFFLTGQRRKASTSYSMLHALAHFFFVSVGNMLVVHNQTCKCRVMDRCHPPSILRLLLTYSANPCGNNLKASWEFISTLEFLACVDTILANMST